MSLIRMWINDSSLVFYQLLEEINKESAIILVSHDIGTVLTMVKNIACVNEILHYHPGANVSEEWLGEKYACPIGVGGAW